MTSSPLSFFSGNNTPEEDPEIFLNGGRGLESMISLPADGYGSGGRLSSHDHDTVHCDDSNDSSPTGFPEESSPDDEDHLHPVMKILRNKELAKRMFDLAIPLVTCLLAYQNPLAMSSSFSLLLILIWATRFSALWFGNLLHYDYFHANNIEFLGYAIIVIAFYSTVASLIGFSLLALIPLLTLVASLVALEIYFCNRNSVSGN